MYTSKTKKSLKKKSNQFSHHIWVKWEFTSFNLLGFQGFVKLYGIVENNYGLQIPKLNARMED